MSELDLSADPNLFDGVQTVTLRQAGSELEQTLDACLLRRLTTREESESAGGAYRQTDASWHLPAAELAFAPLPGDELEEAAGTLWTVLETGRETLGSRWRCVARRFDLAPHLTRLVSVEQAIWRHDSAGATSTTWSPRFQDLPAAIVELTAEVADRYAGLGLRISHQVVFATGVELGPADRIRSGERLFHVRRLRERGRLDRLTVVEVEEWLPVLD